MKIAAARVIAIPCVLALAGLILFWLPHKLRSVKAAAGGLKLVGTLRDFMAAHPDFDQPEPLGHYAGNVEMSTSADGRPVFTGAGFLVLVEWKDAMGRPIAPHLYNDVNYSGA